MKYKSPLFGLLAALLLSVPFWFLLYQPKNDELVQLQSQIDQLESQQVSLNNEIANLEALQSDELTILAELARLEEFIPASTAQPSAFRQFQSTADAAGVEIVSVTFGTPSPIEGAPATGDPNTALADLSLTMVIDGGYFQVVDFLRRLEVDVPRAILLQSVNITEAQDQFPTLSTTWVGKLFAVVPVVPGAAPEPAQTEGEPGAEGGESTPGPTPTAPAEENVS